MASEKWRRMRRIFGQDGRTLIVAMDHGLAFGALAGLENPANAINSVIEGGADAILATYGLAVRFAEEIGRAGLILRVDRVTGGSSGAARLLYRAEDGLRIGADAIACMGFPGSRFEHDTLHFLAQLAAECRSWNVPLLAEMLPQGFEGGEESRTVEAIRSAVRMGAELGADFIKTQYTGTVDGFRSALDACYVPVVVLGGSKMESARDVLRLAREAVDAGAAGVAMGRNIWGSYNARNITRALAAIIHEDATLEEAQNLLQFDDPIDGPTALQK